jgi:CSLREA domain-containing protein
MRHMIQLTRWTAIVLLLTVIALVTGSLLPGVAATASPLPSVTFQAAVLITVDSVGDAVDASPGDGFCDTGGGECTLRAAIMEANASGGADIDFVIDGVGPHVIRPTFPLPEIRAPVIIDGSTEPDYVDAPAVILDGTDAGQAAIGLVLLGGNSEIRGLQISSFGGGAIQVRENGGNTIANNVIGGNADNPCGFGGYNDPFVRIPYLDLEIYDMNDCGQVVGRQHVYVSPTEQEWRGVIWLPEPAFGMPKGLNQFPLLDGEPVDSAISINNRGAVLLGNGLPGPAIRSALWLPEPMYGLPSGYHVVECPLCIFYDMNNHGQIVGVSGGDAFLWENDAITVLGALPAYYGDGSITQTVARGINDDGQIVGVSTCGVEKQYIVDTENCLSDPVLIHEISCNRAVQWNNGGDAIDLGILGTWTDESRPDLSICDPDPVRITEREESNALHINNQGAVLGVSTIEVYTPLDLTGYVETHAAVLWDGGMHDLGDAEPRKINDRGEIILYRRFADGSRSYIFRRADGSELTEEELLGEGYTFTTSPRTVMNNRGEIIVNDGRDSPLVWSPWTGDNGGGKNGHQPALSIIDSPNNIIGGATLLDGNIIGENGGDGILVRGNDAISNQIQNNYIGVAADGETPFPNHAGIRIENAPTNLIADNIIGDNNGNGITIVGAEAAANEVKGNHIGLNVAGDAALPNGGDGIHIDGAPLTIVGGVVEADRNVVSGNIDDGIHIAGQTAVTNTVQGNIIGLDPSGSAPVGNGGNGILVEQAPHSQIGGSQNTTVGGLCTGACNLIGANAKNGIWIAGSSVLTATHTIVQGNYIGTDLTGSVVRQSPVAGDELGNGWSGVAVIGATRNRIGGRTPGAGNLISGNGQHGIELFSGADSNVVEGNLIGTDIAGEFDPDGLPDNGDEMGNGGNGVQIDSSSSNVVGWSAGETIPAPLLICDVACNRIASNGGGGVVILDALSENNAVRGNAIHNNTGLAIDLAGDGTSPNDLGMGLPWSEDQWVDSDSGPNQLLNFPVGVRASFDGVNTYISGLIDVASPGTVTVDVYALSANDLSESGGGKLYLGAVPVVNNSFVLTLTGQLPLDHPFVSATATDSSGATSEFSPICGDPDGDGNPDSDGDSLCDDWESNGIDYDVDGVVDLPLHENQFGADPLRKDIFLEIDYMVGVLHSHRPNPDALSDITRAFSQAPVDGGAGIHLHAMLDEAMLETEEIQFDRGPGSSDDFFDFMWGSNDPADPGERCGTGLRDGHFGTRADRQSADCAQRLGARRLVFRYAIFGHALAGAGNSGIHTGRRILVSLGSWSEEKISRYGGHRQVEAGTLMHELGHTLGLCHGGPAPPGEVSCLTPAADSANINYKPNYLSVMNYSFQTLGVVPTRPLDYSRWKLNALDETSLDETIGIGLTTAQATLWPYTVYSYYDSNRDLCPLKEASTVSSIDWNERRGVEGIKVRTGINDPDEKSGTDPNTGNDEELEECQVSENHQILEGAEDWSNLRYNFVPYASAFDTDQGGISLEAADALASITDFDEDGSSNLDDNCIAFANPDQADGNGDGIGDACSLASLSFAGQAIEPGATTALSVSLAMPAPDSGATVLLYSRDPSSLPVPDEIFIGPGQIDATVPVTVSSAITVSTQVTVAAYYNYSPHFLTTTITLAPPDLSASKILIDASKDGGIWWSPQGGPFDPAQPHQGKGLADTLRALGYDVTELGRGETITAELLDEHGLVIRPAAFTDYSATELAAYRYYVEQGGRLLLMSDILLSGRRDVLAEEFGLEFAGISRGESLLDTFAQHPVTEGVSPFSNVLGSGLVAYDPDTTLLGWLSAGTYLDLDNNQNQDTGEPTDAPVLGLLTVGAGRVLFSGDTNMWFGGPQPLLNNALTWLTESVKLVVVPPVSTTDVGETFTIRLDVQVGAQQIDDAAVYLNFDPNTVQVASVKPGDVLPTVMTNQFDNAAGTLDFAAGTSAESPSGTFTLASVTFNTLADTAGMALLFNTVSPRGSGVTLSGSALDANMQAGSVTTCYDLDGGGVGVSDVQAVASRWRLTADNPDPDGDPKTADYAVRYDMVYDRVIDTRDLMTLIGHWGQTCE